MDSYRDQEMLNQHIHRLKFNLWNFSRKHPYLGSPIRKMGELATKNVSHHYRLLLKRSGPEILPPSSYLRDKNATTQIILQTMEDDTSSHGVELLLNHLRIPYRKFNQDVPRPGPRDAVRVIRCGLPESSAGTPETVTLSANDSENLLPWREGLLSRHAATILRRILRSDSLPLVTGMLPPRIALRLDDVCGIDLKNILSPSMQYGWKPNLGLFMNPMQCAPGEEKVFLQEIARQGLVETTPHAFDSDRFIFFDYPRMRPFSLAEFQKNWDCAKSMLNSWNLDLSAALNTHFHVLSQCAEETLYKDGIRWHFSEILSDQITRFPGPDNLPSGDPTATTGQRDALIRRIYSGHSALDCNQPDSLYDFLMHVPHENPGEQAARRFVEKIRISLECGFAAFATTHEYLLKKLSLKEQSSLWKSIDSELSGLFSGSPQKVTLSELGKICDDHTDTIIESVDRVSDNRFSLTLSGASRGYGYLTIFWRDRLKYLKIPAFTKTHTMEFTHE